MSINNPGAEQRGASDRYAANSCTVRVSGLDVGTSASAGDFSSWNRKAEYCLTGSAPKHSHVDTQFVEEQKMIKLQQGLGQVIFL